MIPQNTTQHNHEVDAAEQREYAIQLLARTTLGGSHYCISTKDPRTGAFQSHWFRTDELPRLPKHLAGRCDVWFSVHPTNAPKEGNRRASNDDVAAVSCMFADFDRKDFPSWEALIDHVKSLPVSPSIIVHSGGGWHCYWRLDNTHIIKTHQQRERLRAIQKSWVEEIGADDGAKAHNQILRLPGTRNFKPEYGPDFPMVHVVEWRLDKQYPLSLFEPEQPKGDEARKRQALAGASASPGEKALAKMPEVSTGNARDKAAALVGASGEAERRRAAYIAAALAGELNTLARAVKGERMEMLNISVLKMFSLPLSPDEKTDVAEKLTMVGEAIGLTKREITATIKSTSRTAKAKPRAHKLPDFTEQRQEVAA